MKTAALCALLLLQLHGNAQAVSPYVINAAGNSSVQGRYSLEWSVGEMAVVEPMRSRDGLVVLSNGFLQPEIIRTGSGYFFGVDEVKILPNPTYDRIEINLSTRQKGELFLGVYDSNGKTVTSLRRSLHGFPVAERVDLSACAGGTYFLLLELKPVPGSGPKTGTYKIVKL